MTADLARQVNELRNQGLSYRGVALYLYACDDEDTGAQLCREAKKFIKYSKYEYEREAFLM